MKSCESLWVGDMESIGTRSNTDCHISPSKVDIFVNHSLLLGTCILSCIQVNNDPYIEAIRSFLFVVVANWSIRGSIDQSNGCFSLHCAISSFSRSTPLRQNHGVSMKVEL